MKMVIKHVLVTAITAAILYLLIGAIVPLAFHKKISPEFSGDFFPEELISETVGAERVLCVDDNNEALLWRLRTILEAEDEIILSTLDLRDDESGTIIISALYDAAERGINIKILVDGLNYTAHLAGSDVFKALVAHPNVEAKAYNPITLIKPWDNHFRLHDKYLISDNTVYMLGGRNTHDLFLGDYGETKNIDRDILVYTDSPSEDTSLAQLQEYFDRVWALPCCNALQYDREKGDIPAAAEFLRARWDAVLQGYSAVLEYRDWKEATIPANRITLCTNPIETDNKEPQLWYMLCSMMEAGNDVIIETPYLIPSGDMYDDLKNVCSAADVSIITNSVETGANIWGCADYMNNKSKLQKLGADIYEFAGEDSSHLKTVIIDDRISIVGSFNFDMRSTYLDTELMLVIDSPELNSQLRENADTFISQSRHPVEDGTYIYGENYTAPEMGIGKEIFYALLRVVILPIRHLL